ncbi:MAG: putative binding protein precursor [Planctomycetes bacterium ADurb.Bin126]|nr:MAG: putative binding protein precursor [Planctomycetes bacterium ADurb.Bin126]HOD80861.1 molybdate ABC transporter substrate-binding protein [Phycisphaerae bacterium]HQL74815.1 molybdate ABC transporter substrate-binding protein [Phycisphaerae bacterium]
MRSIARVWTGTLLAFAVAVCAAGCGDDRSAQNAQEGHKPAELLLYCGAGIRPPAAELAAQFERRTGRHVSIDPAGSEILLSRIRISRRGDLYMPGESHYVDQAQKEGLISQRAVTCYFIPTILVAKGNPKFVRSLDDLLKPGIKVAIGNPEACAVGLQTRRIWDKNKLSWDDLMKNVVFQSLTVNELGTLVKTGTVDVAIVWDAVAAMYEESAQAVSIPHERNVISTVEIAVLTVSKNSEAAAEFLRFAASPEGREVFRKHKYSVELPEGSR